MTFRIDTTRDAQRVALRLIGRIERENVRELEEQIAGASPSVVLDLDEVTLVDVEVVRFLKDAEEAGIELRNCSPFIRTWIATERGCGR